MKTVGEFINHIFKKYKMNQPKNIILCISILIIIQSLISHSIFYNIENFTGGNIIADNAGHFKWNAKLLFDFLTIQKLINPEIVFDTDIIEQQVTPNEMKFFFKHKYFYWSEDTKEKYIDFINHNPSVRIFAKDALNKAQTIYNENAILQLLYTQSREGKFLIYGVKPKPSATAKAEKEYAYGYNSGLQGENDRILCSENNKLVRKQNKYRDGLNQTIITELNNNDLEKEIPGFKFLKNKCNPCLNLFDHKKCHFLFL